jgi:hypothetical protein
MSIRTNKFPTVSSLADSDTFTGVQGGNLDVQATVATVKARMNAISDAGNYFTTDSVEAALQQVGAFMAMVPNNYQPKDIDLTAIAALTTTPFGRSLLTAVDQAAARTLLDAQPADTDLTAIAALTTTPFGRDLLTMVNGPSMLTAIGAQPAASAAPIRTNVLVSTTAAVTPGLADENTMMALSNAGNITVTLPSDTVAFPLGAEVSFSWWGVGKPSFVAGAGATVNASGPLSIRARYSVARAKKMVANTWMLYGDLG